MYTSAGCHDTVHQMFHQDPGWEPEFVQRQVLYSVMVQKQVLRCGGWFGG